MSDEHPIIVLWTTPRSRSTAFERMMIERGDHMVLDEPFSRRYYFGPDRRSNRYQDSLDDASDDDVLRRIFSAAEQAPVFIKDMAYQASGLLTPDLLGRFVNSFLVREPTATLASFAKKWPDLTEEEAGFEALADAFAISKELLGGDPPVIEAQELVADPASIVQK